MTFFDFAFGFMLFCKILMVLQQILALSSLKFEVQVFKTVSASPEVRHSSCSLQCIQKKNHEHTFGYCG